MKIFIFSIVEKIEKNNKMILTEYGAWLQYDGVICMFSFT